MKPTAISWPKAHAVIFDSNLFRKTDEISFADGYESRRINITMLYGRRQRG